MKHVREICKRLKNNIPGLQITWLRQRTHIVVQLELGAQHPRLAIATSPRNIDHAIVNTVREAKCLLGLHP